MKITLPIGCTAQSITEALNSIQPKYNNNLRFKRMERDGATRDGHPKFTVTITVNTSRDKGSVIKEDPFTGKTRRVAAACWHAHGSFLSALPEGTLIQSAPVGRLEVGKSNLWVDYNVGSHMFPAQASDQCLCDS